MQVEVRAQDHLGVKGGLGTRQQMMTTTIEDKTKHWQLVRYMLNLPKYSSKFSEASVIFFYGTLKGLASLASTEIVQ